MKAKTYIVKVAADGTVAREEFNRADPLGQLQMVVRGVGLMFFAQAHDGADHEQQEGRPEQPGQYRNHAGCADALHDHCPAVLQNKIFNKTVGKVLEKVPIRRRECNDADYRGKQNSHNNIIDYPGFFMR